MNQVTISIPPMFLPVVDELVQYSQAGTREQWLSNVVRGVVFDYQLRKEFSAPHQKRVEQLNEFWPGPNPFPAALPGHHP
jgi:hypothetical protein